MESTVRITISNVLYVLRFVAVMIGDVAANNALAFIDLNEPPSPSNVSQRLVTRDLGFIEDG